jgi:hypothetical protein
MAGGNQEKAKVNDSTISQIDQVRKPAASLVGPARILILALVSFSLGIAVSAFYFSHRASSNAASDRAPDSTAVEPAPSGVPQFVALQSEPAPRIDPVALAAVQRSIPNLELASLKEGTRVLRRTALAEFQQAARDFQTRQQEAEQAYNQASIDRSDSRQRAAAKKLKELQAQQMEELKEIAANSAAQIEALHDLKKAAP